MMLRNVEGGNWDAADLYVLAAEERSA